MSRSTCSRGRTWPRSSTPQTARSNPYGGFHAVGRDRQLSNYALSGELENLRNLAVMLPLVFLGVAAFLVNVVVSRLVFLERSQIAVLKALGFRDLRIGAHYLGWWRSSWRWRRSWASPEACGREPG